MTNCSSIMNYSQYKESVSIHTDFFNGQMWERFLEINEHRTVKALVLLPYSPVLLTESRAMNTAEPLKSSINHVAWFSQDKNKSSRLMPALLGKPIWQIWEFLIIISKLQLDELKVLDCSPDKQCSGILQLSSALKHQTRRFKNYRN